MKVRPEFKIYKVSNVSQDLSLIFNPPPFILALEPLFLVLSSRVHLSRGRCFKKSKLSLNFLKFLRYKIKKTQNPHPHTTHHPYRPSLPNQIYFFLNFISATKISIMFFMTPSSIMIKVFETFLTLFSGKKNFQLHYL